jgi:hypothetical protein
VNDAKLGQVCQSAGFEGGSTTTERLELTASRDLDASFAFGISQILNGVDATVSTSRRKTQAP